MGAPYSAQGLSYRKILGQLNDAGNTTIAHYLDLLENAGLTAFVNRFPQTRTITVGSGAYPVEEFLSGKVPLFE